MRSYHERHKHFRGYLKSKRSLIVFDYHSNLKYKYGNRHFSCKDILYCAQNLQALLETIKSSKISVI